MVFNIGQAIASEQRRGGPLPVYSAFSDSKAFSDRQSTLSNSYNQVSKISVAVILTYMYMELRYCFGFAGMICEICVWYSVYKVRVKQVSPSSDQLM